MRIRHPLLIGMLFAVGAPVSSVAAEPVDISTIAADLVVPTMTDDAVMPGRRVREVHPDWQGTEVYHSLYLPTHHQSGKSYPVIVELAGNGGFRSALGDVCTGHPRGASLVSVSRPARILSGPVCPT